MNKCEYKVRKLTDEDIKHIKDLYSNGVKPLEISKQLKIKYESVKYHVYGVRNKTKKKVVRNSKQKNNHSKNNVNRYHRNKKNDWFLWKADCLISSFQRRHKDSNVKYNYYTSRKEYSEILKTKLTTCEYCGEKLTKDNISVDHKTPVSRGGDTNDENITYCCSKCNSSKGSMNDKEYLELLELIKSWEDNGKYILSRLRSSGYIFKKRKK